MTNELADPTAQLQISEAEIAQYERDGALVLRGLFSQAWVERIRHAVDEVLEDEALRRTGGFQRVRNLRATHPTFGTFVTSSPAAYIAAAMMRTDTVRLYFDQLFVKDPGTTTPSPWHQDRTYWPISQGEVCSIWLALDHVTQENSGLSYVRGSHLDKKLYTPVGFSDGHSCPRC